MKRCVILHEDDIAMSHGANIAFEALSRLGTCSSGSVMVPCPWFPEVELLIHRLRAPDLGVHLTLTSETKPYRWRPLTAPPASAGLTDQAGYFWPDVPTLRQRAVPLAVEVELRAQIDLAIARGIDVTHLDAHMGSALAPEFVDIYLRLGRDYQLPILLTRTLDLYGPRHNLGRVNPERYDAVVAEAASLGFPIFDAALETPWGRTSDAESTYRQMFAAIPEGLTFFSLHFNAPGDFDAIVPALAHIRVAEYELFGSSPFAQFLGEQDIEIINFFRLREELRGSLSDAESATLAAGAA